MQQEDIDRAFADFDRARLLLHPHPARDPRHVFLCVGCGSRSYTFDSGGTGDAGARVCNDCGVVQPGPIIFEQMYNRDCRVRSSNYKRIHHWHERVSQLLLMESRIPPEHMLAIGERLLDGSQTSISKDSIRAVLRSLGLQPYIEKWLQIIERCTGVLPPCPGPVILQRLDEQFLELQQPFAALKHTSRRNFLNYNYVFCRLLQRMNCTQFCMFFPLIRSKLKLRALDETYGAMARSVGWEVPPLTHVTPFSVRLHEPRALLARLRASVASLAPAVPRPVPMKTTIHMLGHLAQKVDRQPPKRRRSDPIEPRSQTLALQLKRRRLHEA